MSVIFVFMVNVCDTVGISLGNKKATSEMPVAEGPMVMGPSRDYDWFFWWIK